jgi:hypothetical protein
MFIILYLFSGYIFHNDNLTKGNAKFGDNDIIMMEVN